MISVKYAFWYWRYGCRENWMLNKCS